MSNIDDLLDSTLDDLTDLPSFKPFSAGAHRCKLTLEKKEIADHPAVEATLTMVETVEYVEPTDADFDPEEEGATDRRNKAGDSCNAAFFLDNEIGEGKFKALAVVLGAALGLNHNGQIVEQTTDIDVIVVTGVRQDKTDKDKFYLDIKELNVV